MAMHEDASPTDRDETGPDAAAPSDRRHFLKSTLVAGSAATSLLGLSGNHVSMARAQGLQGSAGSRAHYHLPASDQTVHWGYFSKLLAPVVEVDSGDFVTIETLTHHAGDDRARMIQGDPGAESVYRWDANGKGVDRRHKRQRAGHERAVTAAPAVVGRGRGGDAGAGGGGRGRHP